MFNTHLDHIGVEARERGITLILDRINSLNSTNRDIILMGDLNVEEDDKVIQDITKVLDDSRKKAEVVLGPEGTFNAFEYHEPALKRIDYIMVSKNIAVQKYATFTTAINSKYPSDHFPVFVKLKLKD